MKVIERIEMFEAQIEQLKEKYCDECQEWFCENCWARTDEEMSKVSEMEMAYGEYLNG